MASHVRAGNHEVTGWKATAILLIIWSLPFWIGLLSGRSL